MSARDLSRLLAENVAPIAGRGSWHGGPTVVGALRGVSVRQALWRPAPGRHSIWELALHIAYWHHVITQRLRGTAREPFPRCPADWPAVPARATEADWKADRALIRAAHLEVAATIRAVPPSQYGRRPSGNRKWTFGETILGAAQHEAYHTGQIQLLKRLWTSRP
ncbi:MAG: DinB family protein [Gemmatimonadales bacterium]